MNFLSWLLAFFLMLLPGAKIRMPRLDTYTDIRDRLQDNMDGIMKESAVFPNGRTDQNGTVERLEEPFPVQELFEEEIPAPDDSVNG